jgi:hypothetical protein
MTPAHQRNRVRVTSASDAAISMTPLAMMSSRAKGTQAGVTSNNFSGMARYGNGRRHWTR